MGSYSGPAGAQLSYRYAGSAIVGAVLLRGAGVPLPTGIAAIGPNRPASPAFV